jgi:Zn ribbon nucleic-acid-binding protein
MIVMERMNVTMSLDVGRRCPICGATHQPGWFELMGSIEVIDCVECGNLSKLTRWV